MAAPPKPASWTDNGVDYVGQVGLSSFDDANLVIAKIFGNLLESSTNNSYKWRQDSEEENHWTLAYIENNTIAAIWTTNKKSRTLVNPSEPHLYITQEYAQSVKKAINLRTKNLTRDKKGVHSSGLGHKWSTGCYSRWPAHDFLQYFKDQNFVSATLGKVQVSKTGGMTKSESYRIFPYGEANSLFIEWTSNNKIGTGGKTVNGLTCHQLYDNFIAHYDKVSNQQQNFGNEIERSPSLTQAILPSLLEEHTSSSGRKIKSPKRNKFPSFTTLELKNAKTFLHKDSLGDIKDIILKPIAFQRKILNSPSKRPKAAFTKLNTEDRKLAARESAIKHVLDKAAKGENMDENVKVEGVSLEEFKTGAQIVISVMRPLLAEFEQNANSRKTPTKKKKKKVETPTKEQELRDLKARIKELEDEKAPRKNAGTNPT